MRPSRLPGAGEEARATFGQSLADATAEGQRDGFRTLAEVEARVMTVIAEVRARAMTEPLFSPAAKQDVRRAMPLPRKPS